MASLGTLGGRGTINKGAFSTLRSSAGAPNARGISGRPYRSASQLAPGTRSIIGGAGGRPNLTPPVPRPATSPHIGPSTPMSVPRRGGYR